jgi:hypothetical protein
MPAQKHSFLRLMHAPRTEDLSGFITEGPDEDPPPFSGLSIAPPRAVYADDGAHRAVPSAKRVIEHRGKFQSCLIYKLAKLCLA